MSFDSVEKFYGEENYKKDGGSFSLPPSAGIISNNGESYLLRLRQFSPNLGHWKISMSEFGGVAFSSILIAYCDPYERSCDRPFEPHRRFSPAYTCGTLHTTHPTGQPRMLIHRAPYTRHVSSDARGNSKFNHNFPTVNFSISNFIITLPASPCVRL
jgi:hypothetical protein